MRRVVAGFVVLMGCRGESVPARTQQDGAASNDEPVATETKAAPQTKPAPTPSPTPSPTVRPHVDPPDDPLAVLMNPGNRWIYREIWSWHDAVHEVQVVREEVSEHQVLGRYQLATLTRTGPGGPQTHYRIRDGKRILRLEYDAVPPKTEVEVEQRLKRGGSVEYDLTATEPRLVCSPLGCLHGNWYVESDTDGAGLWPGVGIVDGSRSDYSSETGDGRTDQRLLLGFELTDPIPTLPGGPEPAAVAPIRAELVAAARAKGKLTAFSGTRYSLLAAHRDGADLETGWSNDGGRGLATVVETMSGPCGQITADLVACPTGVADRAVEHGGGKQVPQQASGPRAYLVRDGASWRLAAVFLGGAGDLYTGDEGGGPTVPYRGP